MESDHEESKESRRQFEDRLKREGADIMDYAREEYARREEAPEEASIIAASKTVETQVIETLKTRERLGEDALTGAKNLRKYHEETRRLQKEARILKSATGVHRKTDVLIEEPFSLIAFDIDHFKNINDTYGHNAGDEVLREIVRRVQDVLRNGDMLARCGGEEFRIIALTVNGSAPSLAERIRQIIAKTPFLIHANNGRTLTVKATISLGVSPYDTDTHNMELRSDTALYGAKGNYRPPRQQRNQVWEWNKAKGKALPYRQGSTISDSTAAGDSASGGSAAAFS